MTLISEARDFSLFHCFGYRLPKNKVLLQFLSSQRFLFVANNKMTSSVSNYLTSTYQRFHHQVLINLKYHIFIKSVENSVHLSCRLSNQIEQIIVVLTTAN